ncbi:protein ORF13 [Cyprinid herpesvirus 3]|uniref:ORF13L n=1 Tax=Cyprinid herpesvirus 3 TaxID=180230 RepID=A3QMI5_CYHV3|nr:unnamed protein product [Cyprinid herpesvirus 3]ABF81797.1 hypothetical protein [Cyprinid herpesvirus 3]ABG42844.1 protein ORF13 [Cyprinid herpesvirus 3]AIC32368.1 ORF13L [Cyprinid herpesvirus 3]AJP55507.1 protein ORF13 [Cyprinid herpesvirus 3]AJP55664.1 protein ORF13 [Cyprinid herpesvirus 3]
MTDWTSAVDPWYSDSEDEVAPDDELGLWLQQHKRRIEEMTELGENVRFEAMALDARRRQLAAAAATYNCHDSHCNIS